MRVYQLSLRLYSFILLRGEKVATYQILLSYRKNVLLYLVVDSAISFVELG